jgi:saccharopine dehydrogenase-like NADP-dependent oxidoreductase
MKSILVLGAGLVARPLVRYLLEQPDVNVTVASLEEPLYQVTVASRTISKAESLVGDAKNGRALTLDVTDEAALEELVKEHDMSISLLPYVHHPTVARLCIKHRKDMVTTSYVSPAMRELDGPAREAGIVILNEIGVDPGMDHMSAMKVIHEVQKAGGKIVGFNSITGGLPAPDANDNPYGYKFSWSPRGVLMAGRNAARFLKDGEEVNIASEDLFDEYHEEEVPGLGTLEAYANRDSIPYIETYGLEGVRDMYRGTYRNTGWCRTLKKMVDLGWLSDEPMDGLEEKGFSDLLYRLMDKETGGDIRADLASHLGIEAGSDIIDRMEWLGLLGSDPLPEGADNPLDILVARMLQKMKYREGEKDMLVMRHSFDIEYPDGRKETRYSTLIDYGISEGDSSMSRTVGLPAAIGAKMVLEGTIGVKGVQIPVLPDIYEPILKELEEMGIKFTEEILEG